MGFEDLANASPEEENIQFVSPESFLLKKLDEVVPVMMTLLTRVKILEDQIAWLLSKDVEYVKALDAYEEANKESSNDEQKD